MADKQVYNIDFLFCLINLHLLFIFLPVRFLCFVFCFVVIVKNRNTQKRNETKHEFLHTPQGFLTKEGGNFKTWRKRWMVLRKGSIYYSKDQSSGELGVIRLEVKKIFLLFLFSFLFYLFLPDLFQFVLSSRLKVLSVIRLARARRTVSKSTLLA